MVPGKGRRLRFPRSELGAGDDEGTNMDADRGADADTDEDLDVGGVDLVFPVAIRLAAECVYLSAPKHSRSRSTCAMLRAATIPP